MGCCILVAMEPYQTTSAPAVVVSDVPSEGMAILLEVLPALLIQTFGIGNLYAGNLTAGLLLMFGYWLSCAVNFFLCFIMVGFITWPLTWVAFLVVSLVLAKNQVQKKRHRAMTGQVTL